MNLQQIDQRKTLPTQVQGRMQGTASQPSIDDELDNSVGRGILLTILIFVAMILWASLAPLDEGVPTDGKVTIANKNKVIQHLSGGIVSNVYVTEGQLVKKGDLLVAIDAAATKAKFEEIRQHYLSLRSSENRLQTEKHGGVSIQFHKDLSDSADPNIRSKMQDQAQLLMARRQLLMADVAQLQQSIQAEHASIQANQQLIASKHTELGLVQQQMKDIKEAVDEGYVPKVQYAELEQRSQQLQGDIAGIKGQVNKSEQLIKEFNSKIASRNQAERKDVEEHLAEVRAQVDADKEKVTALQDEMTRTEIRAPSDGQVIGLQVYSAGSVIQPGQKLMFIVPVGEKLLLDAKIPTNIIDRVKPAQLADVRFSSFAHSPQLVIDGVVKSISNDIVSDPYARSEALRNYYLARIEVTEKGMQTLGNRVMKPGMPVQIVIKTGERTYLDYLLHPLIKRLSASLKEE